MGTDKNSITYKVLEVRPREKPSEKPFAWVLVRREETYKHYPDSGKLYEARIELSYKQLIEKYGLGFNRRVYFAGEFKEGMLNELDTVALTGGGFFIDPAELRGHRIGTYILNEIVTWAKRWPDADVKIINLQRSESAPDNKGRRNWLYEQFKISFKYNEPSQESGSSNPMLARDLEIVNAWKENIKELELENYISELLFAKNHAESELEYKKKIMKGLVQEIREMQDHPIKAVVAILYRRYASEIILFILAGVAIAAAWSAGLN